MKICSRCLLPETFPGISFNADGMCTHCQKHIERQSNIEEEKKRQKQQFIELVKEEVFKPRSRSGPAGQRAYDLLMAYSGGRNSTYAMSLLKNKYKLRVLAVSLDNGFLTPELVAAIGKVTEALGIDHLFFKPRWDLLKKVFTAAAERELYAKKTLERASAICTSCTGLLTSLCLKMAVEQDIPLVGFGWPPGRAPLETSIRKNSAAFIRTASQTILNALRGIVGEEINAYFLQDKHYGAEKLPYTVHPLAWECYNETTVAKELQKAGWNAPKISDCFSGNCLLSAFANEVHLQRYKFHPSAWEVACSVREGAMTREEGHLRIYGQQDEHLVSAARERLAS